MARTKVNDGENYIPGDDEIALLEDLLEGSLQNKHEIVSIHSNFLNRTINISREEVYRQASVMASNTQLCSLFGIDKESLNKHFKREVNMGRAFARQRLLTRFYNLAVYGNNPADRIFALKNWANMSDQGVTEQSENDDGVEFKVRRPSRAKETHEAVAAERLLRSLNNESD